MRLAGNGDHFFFYHQARFAAGAGTSTIYPMHGENGAINPQRLHHLGRIVCALRTILPPSSANGPTIPEDWSDFQIAPR